MKLRPLALALTLGILAGVGLLAITWWSVIIESPGTTIRVLSYIYLGYKVTWLGGLIGLVWGFIDGFVGGYLFALIYNLFIRSEKVDS